MDASGRVSVLFKADSRSDRDLPGVTSISLARRLFMTVVSLITRSESIFMEQATLDRPSLLQFLIFTKQRVELVYPVHRRRLLDTSPSIVVVNSVNHFDTFIRLVLHA